MPEMVAFPGLPTKAFLFHNVSERVHPHVLREEWGSMNKSPLPPSLETMLFTCCEAATWASVKKKETHFSLRDYPGAIPNIGIYRVNHYKVKMCGFVNKLTQMNPLANQYYFLKTTQ